MKHERFVPNRAVSVVLVSGGPRIEATAKIFLQKFPERIVIPCNQAPKKRQVFAALAIPPGFVK
jgi:hypothetical protein